ncbi:MAG: hypothetical protein ACRENL_08800 [Candidatus Dormibacteria bacterium]
MTGRRARAAAAARAAGRAVVAMPRGARLAVIGVAIAAAFVAVVLPLFSSGGAPHAEISGALPGSVAAGQRVRVDIAVDNVGDSVIYPVCVALRGDGASLVSANFQGLDQVSARGNRVCGGQLVGQETISVTLVLTVTRRGSTHLSLLPQQGATVIGPAFSGTVGGT